jgi:MFS family permease
MNLQEGERQGIGVVAACFTALLVSPLSLTLPTLGLFVKPVSTAFGWDRATFFMGPSIGAVVGALLAPYLGSLADRFGARPVLATGVIIYASAEAMLGSIGNWRPTYYALNIVLYAAGQVQTTALYSRVIASWFDDRRGLMLAIATSGLGVGGMITPLIAKSLMEAFGWRCTYFGLGLLIGAVALPPILLLVREEQSAVALHSRESRDTASKALTVSQAARTRTYWTLVAFYFGVSFALTGIVSNLIPMMEERLLTRRLAVFTVSSVALGQAAGRLVSGFLLDRTISPRLSLLFFAGSATGLVALAFSSSPTAALCAALTLGLAWRAEGETAGYFVSRYFGIGHMAQITGTLFTAIGIGAAASQLSVAKSFDITGNYQSAILTAVGIMFVACVLLATLGKYVFLIRRTIT